MKHNIMKRSIAAVLAVLCVAAYAPANVGMEKGFGGAEIVAKAEETVTSGEWSTEAKSLKIDEDRNITYACADGTGNWTYDTSTYTLTITGTGATPFNGNNNGTTSAPWKSYQKQIKRIVIGDGITEINTRCFLGFSSLVAVELPDTLQIIGYAAFHSCNNLQEITLPKNINEVRIAAFAKSHSNFKINLSSDFQIPKNGFYSKSAQDQSSRLAGVSAISGVELSKATIEHYFDNFQNVKVNGLTKAQYDALRNITPQASVAAGSSIIEATIYLPIAADTHELIKNTFKVTVDGQELTESNNGLTWDSTHNRYSFTFKTAAKNMVDSKNVQVKWGNVELKSGSYSIADILKHGIAYNEAGAYTDAQKDTAAALLQYGAAAQTYFGYHTGNLASAGVERPITTVPAPTTAALDKTSAAKVVLGDCTYRAMNARFDAGTSLMLAFKVPSVEQQDASVLAVANALKGNETLSQYVLSDRKCYTIGNNLDVQPDTTGKFVVVEYKNIGILDLGDNKLTVGNVGFNVLQYLAVPRNETEAVKPLCDALYTYYHYAKQQ